MLNQIYPNNVEKEWSSISDGQRYTPRIDIAVGPFAIQTQLGQEYDQLMGVGQSNILIRCLIRHHLLNIADFHNTDTNVTDEHVDELFNNLMGINYNARCLIAVEIENTATRKHLMGSAINASALGRIGIAIPWTDEKFRAIIKLVRYFEFLSSVGKPTFGTQNLLIVRSVQFHQSIQSVL